MVLRDFLPHRRSYDNIRECAAQVLSCFNPSGKLPVDIEHIVDVGLGINIVPCANLKKEIGIEGGLSVDRKNIYIDKGLYFNSKTKCRCRFTIAHELGHYLLHAAIYRRAARDCLDSEGIYNLIKSISNSASYERYEWQANAFAGLVLVPSLPLEQSLLTGRQKASFRGEVNTPSTCAHLSSLIAPEYGVSTEVILRRGQLDGYWSSAVVQGYYQKYAVSF